VRYEHGTGQEHEHQQPKQVAGNPVGTKQTPLWTHRSLTLKNWATKSFHGNGYERVAFGYLQNCNRNAGRDWLGTTAIIIEWHDAIE
jgi:hypothetical protein